jgi:hypothetical protein
MIGVGRFEKKKISGREKSGNNYFRLSVSCFPVSP